MGIGMDTNHGEVLSPLFPDRNEFMTGISTAFQARVFVAF